LVAHRKLLLCQALTNASRPRNHERGVPRDPAPLLGQAPRPERLAMLYHALTPSWQDVVTLQARTWSAERRWVWGVFGHMLVRRP
jgi:hypothetical protein